MPLIGLLSGGSPESTAHLVAAFRKGLSETGYVEGHNVAIEFRWAEDHDDRLPTLARRSRSPSSGCHRRQYTRRTRRQGGNNNDTDRLQQRRSAALANSFEVLGMPSRKFVWDPQHWRFLQRKPARLPTR